jgi:hypothetical protein
MGSTPYGCLSSKGRAPGTRFFVSKLIRLAMCIAPSVATILIDLGIHGGPLDSLGPVIGGPMYQPGAGHTDPDPS